MSLTSHGCVSVDEVCTFNAEVVVNGRRESVDWKGPLEQRP